MAAIYDRLTDGIDHRQLAWARTAAPLEEDFKLPQCGSRALKAGGGILGTSGRAALLVGLLAPSRVRRWSPLFLSFVDCSA